MGDHVINGEVFKELAAKLDGMPGEFTGDELAALDAMFTLAGALLGELDADVDGFAVFEPLDSSTSAPFTRSAFAASWLDVFTDASSGPSALKGLERGFGSGLLSGLFG